MLKINNVLSCFDGASCGQMALNHAGIPFKKYFASEINTDSIAIALKNYPKTIQLGDIMKIKSKDLPKIDLIFAGSPCTDLSRAGKQLGMATLCGIKVTNYKQYLKLKREGKEFTQSCLFWEFIRLVKELKPKYFFLENTKMNAMWLYLITKELGVEPVLINSSLLSAQNRERYYWTNLPGFVYPKDKGITFDQIVPGASSCGWRGRKFKKTDEKYTRVLTHRTDGKANCVVTSPSSTNLYEKNGTIQPITIEMAEKLQTWPIGYTNVPGLSKASKYHALGNGWTKNVIVHFLKCASKYYKTKMKYVSIDIETSGLNHDMNHVLSIGAIIEDTNNKLPYDELPKFNAIVLQNNIQGSPRAITMNKEIISMMGEYLEGTDEVRNVLNNNSGYKFYEEEDVVKEFYRFLWSNGFGHELGSGNFVNTIDGVEYPAIGGKTKPITLNVAGKNFGTFDKLFLQELPWWQKLIRTRQRVLDPAILCVDWSNDTSLPSLTVCKERMKVEGIVTHNALEDAWDVIEILRKFY